MAFRGETSAVRVSDVHLGSGDAASAVIEANRVAPVDALRVRVAVGFMIVVAMIDCLLYLPRLF